MALFDSVLHLFENEEVIDPAISELDNSKNLDSNDSKNRNGEEENNNEKIMESVSCGNLKLKYVSIREECGLTPVARLASVNASMRFRMNFEEDIQKSVDKGLFSDVSYFDGFCLDKFQEILYSGYCEGYNRISPFLPRISKTSGNYEMPVAPILTSYNTPRFVPPVYDVPTISIPFTARGTCFNCGGLHNLTDCKVERNIDIIRKNSNMFKDWKGGKREIFSGRYFDEVVKSEPEYGRVDVSTKLPDISDYKNVRSSVDADYSKNYFRRSRSTEKDRSYQSRSRRSRSPEKNRHRSRSTEKNRRRSRSTEKERLYDSRLRRSSPEKERFSRRSRSSDRKYDNQYYDKPRSMDAYYADKYRGVDRVSDYSRDRNIGQTYRSPNYRETSNQVENYRPDDRNVNYYGESEQTLSLRRSRFSKPLDEKRISERHYGTF